MNICKSVNSYILSLSWWYHLISICTSPSSGMLRENEDSPLKKTHWGATRALSGFGLSTRFLKVEPSGLKMFEDRNEEIIENVCVVNSANIVRCTCCKLRHWDIPTFQYCNRKPRKQDHRSPLQLCAAHCRSLTIFFCVKSPVRRTRKTKTAWNNSWNTTFRHDMGCCMAVQLLSTWLHLFLEFFQACLQVLLQKKWASLRLTEAVARMWRRIVFSPFLSAFPFKSCRDWTMWYSAACQANRMSHSRKERTCDLDGPCCDVHRIRVAHNDVLPMVIFCTPAWQLTPILMILTTSIVLLFNAYEPCTSLNWKNVLNTWGLF